MISIPTVLAFVGSLLALTACSAAPPHHDAAAKSRVEHAATILNYPHDHHVFAELPPNLSPVPGARAQLVRRADRVEATIGTRMTPGHVGKLLAVIINNPTACKVPTPGTACGPHEEEFNVDADGGFYLGSGAVAGADGAISLSVTAHVGDTSNVLCGGAANPRFDSCARGFALRNPRRAEVTLVVLDNGPASDDDATRARQLASAQPCPTCPPFTTQVAIGFGREAAAPPHPNDRD